MLTGLAPPQNIPKRIEIQDLFKKNYYSLDKLCLLFLAKKMVWCCSKIPAHSHYIGLAGNPEGTSQKIAQNVFKLNFNNFITKLVKTFN